MGFSILIFLHVPLLICVQKHLDVFHKIVQRYGATISLDLILTPIFVLAKLYESPCGLCMSIYKWLCFLHRNNCRCKTCCSIQYFYALFFSYVVADAGQAVKSVTYTRRHGTAPSSIFSAVRASNLILLSSFTFLWFLYKGSRCSMVPINVSCSGPPRGWYLDLATAADISTVLQTATFFFPKTPKHLCVVAIQTLSYCILSCALSAASGAI